jgi:hypothetical protein
LAFFWEWPLPVINGGFHCHHVDYVNWAGFNTELTASAFVTDYGVHKLGGANNGIHWAGLDAFGATNAVGLVNNSDHGRFFDAVFWVQRQWLNAEQVGQCLNTGFAARRALVNLGFACGNRFRVRAAAGKTALAALGLWQYRINLVN